MQINIKSFPHSIHISKLYSHLLMEILFLSILVEMASSVEGGSIPDCVSIDQNEDMSEDCR